MSANGADIFFPHLGITIQHLQDSITIGGFRIAFYGMIIGAAFLLSMLLVEQVAKQKGLNPEVFWDFFIYVIIFGILGARAYYVLFNWEYYGSHPEKILQIREGGLAVYGGIIAVVAVLFFFCRKRKMSFPVMLDTFAPGLLLGQSIGRWGNFFNCEAFGCYTDTLLAMRIKRSRVNAYMIDQSLLDHLITDGGIEYIQAHPTFFYESAWNFLSLFFVLWFTKHRQKKKGEAFLLYLMLYGTGRFLIEGLRTDSLMIPGTTLRVSQCLSLAVAAAAAAVFAAGRKALKNEEKTH